MLEREELKINSLLDVPHALTKEVVQSIGYECFVNPIVAHLRLLQSKWRISRHCAIDVITPINFVHSNMSHMEQIFPNLKKNDRRSYRSSSGTDIKQ